MSTETTGSDVLDQFRNVSNKLKKRFLRKLNVTVACDTFTSLAQQCEKSELPEYAAMCWTSASRCEGSIKNVAGETNCLIKAGGQFLRAEENDHKIGCCSPSQENLQAALGSYAHAASRYPPNHPFIVSLNLEVAQFMKKINIDSDTEDILLDAVASAGDDLETKIFCLNLLASEYIHRRIYVSALNTFSQMVTEVEKTALNGAKADVLLKCEICRLFLLLILKPAPSKVSPDLAKLLEKYTWSDANDSALKFGMTEKMYVTLQSLVASCQSQDTKNLDSLQTELDCCMGSDERELLRNVVQSYDR